MGGKGDGGESKAKWKQGDFASELDADTTVGLARETTELAAGRDLDPHSWSSRSRHMLVELYAKIWRVEVWLILWPILNALEKIKTVPSARFPHHIYTNSRFLKVNAESALCHEWCTEFRLHW